MVDSEIKICNQGLYSRLLQGFLPSANAKKAVSTHHMQASTYCHRSNKQLYLLRQSLEADHLVVARQDPLRLSIRNLNAQGQNWFRERLWLIAGSLC